jgi:tripartite-type tricarboxylate transporter receptor subunit TctC
VNITRRRALAASGLGSLGALSGLGGAGPRGALAQEAWPRQTIRIVVPFPAGGTTDVLARLYAPRMAETLGVPVVVENRGGAGGSIGADAVARATPDGYTLLFHNLTFSTTTATLESRSRAPHSIERDFIPISMGANVPFVLLAHPDVPAQNLREFVAYARGRQEPLFFGSTGLGSTMHLLAELVQREGGFRMEHVPFRGAAPLVIELVAGRVQFGGDQIPTSLGHVRAGALRALATVAPTRASALPDLPTAREQGFPSVELVGWNGFFAPARTPQPVIERLHHAIVVASRHPELVRRIREDGAEPGGDSPQEFAATVHAQVAHVRTLLREVDLKLE